MLPNINNQNFKSSILIPILNIWISFVLILSSVLPSIAIAYSENITAKASTVQKSQLQVISEQSVISLQNDIGKIQKEIKSFNADTGEATIKLSFTHYPSDEVNIEYADTPEIYIILDERMATWENYDIWQSIITNFCKKILDKNSRTQIGFIGVQGPICDAIPNPDGSGDSIIGPNDESGVEGSSLNAEIVVPLTNDLDELKFGLANMNLSKQNYYSNLQAALELACQDELYSGTKSKLLISFFTTTPITANGLSNIVSFPENADPFPYYTAYYEKMVAKTAPAITNLANHNIELLMVRPTNSSFNMTWHDPDRNFC